MSITSTFEEPDGVGDQDGGPHGRDATPSVPEALVREHEGLVRSVAARYARRGEPIEDLVQVGFIGLLKAMDRYDASHGTRFSTYAVATIDGELKRHFRDRAWTLRTSRRLKDLYVRAKRSADDLTNELGRCPTPAEVAEDAGAPEEEVRRALDAGLNLHPRSLDAATVDLRERAPACPSSGEDQTHVDDRDEVDRLLVHLPPEWERVVRLRFFHGLTQAEIAERVGSTQVRVSRILARSLAQLRAGTGRMAKPSASRRPAVRRRGTSRHDELSRRAVVGKS